MAQPRSAEGCAGAGAAAGSTTAGAGGCESTMYLSPRSQARSLESGPRGEVGVFSVMTTFR
jgi:hypothetical protein